MYLNSNKKKLIIKNYGLSVSDTGNCIVQIALLTFKIKNITNHLKYNKKDFNTERSLQILVSKRKKLLKYIEKKNNTQL